MARYTVALPELQSTCADRAGNPSTPWTANYCIVQGSSSWWYRTFIKHDFSLIPPNAEIISATLRVYCLKWNTNGGSGTTNISRVTQDWDESTLTWNNQPSTTGTYLASNVKPPAVGSWTDWDITNLVTEWVSGTYPNYGLYIKNNNEGSYRVDWNISNHRNADGNASYIEVVYNVDDYYYLVEDDTTIYSLLSGELEDLDTKECTPELFQEYGIKEIPTWEQMHQLIDPRVLAWTPEIIPDSLYDPPITVTMTATPLPQTIISNKIDLSDVSITGIESAVVTCEGDVLFSVSFDDKQTWKAWNGTEWSTVSEELSGMTKELFESITYDDWLTLYTGASSFYIKVILSSMEQSITQIYVDFAN